MSAGHILRKQDVVAAVADAGDIGQQGVDNQNP